jgi:hypothetical protein
MICYIYNKIQMSFNENPEYIKTIIEDECYKDLLQVLSEIGKSSYWTYENKKALFEFRSAVMDGFIKLFDFTKKKYVVDSCCRHKKLFDFNTIIYDNTDNNERETLTKYLEDYDEKKYYEKLFTIIFNTELYQYTLLNIRYKAINI